MKYVYLIPIFAAKLRDNVELGRDTLSAFNVMFKRTRSPQVKAWINRYFVPFFLGFRFTGNYFIDEKIAKKLGNNHQIIHPDKALYIKIPNNLLADRLKGKEAYILELDATWMGKCKQLLEFMDGLDWKTKEIKWEVPTAFGKLEEYLKKCNDRSGISPVLRCNNGYVWYQLLDDYSQKAEGNRMQNCVGTDEHAEELAKGEAAFLSLRRDSLPHVDIKYNPKTLEISDIRGKQNKEPIKKYWPYICDIVNHLKLKPVKFAASFFKNLQYSEDKGYYCNVEVKSRALRDEYVLLIL